MFKVKEKILSTDSYKLKNESCLSPPLPVSIPKLKHCPQLLICPNAYMNFLKSWTSYYRFQIR